MCANSDYYTANLNTANQWQPKIIFITAACWMQSLLYRHVLNQILSLPLSSYCVSISGVKPPANDHFLENNHNCTLTRQTRLQHSPETTLQEKKKTCAVYSLCQWAPAAASKRLTCLGRARYVHQLGKGADVTLERHSGEFLPQLHPRRVYILRPEVSWASTIPWHAHRFPHS